MQFRTLRQTVSLLLVLSLIVWVACEKNPIDNEKKEPPVLPPSESMQFDLSLFNNSPLQKATVFSKQNFTNAALRLFVINTVVSVELAVPVIVFAAAASQTPELQSDGKFHWVYSITNGGNTFEADLAGWIDIPNKQAVWEMYISSNNLKPPLNKFLWYTGRSEIDTPSGYWLFYDPEQPTASVEAVRIDWTIVSEDDRTLTFTGLQEGSEIEGDTLNYRWQGTLRSVTLYDAAEEKTVLIHWDAETGAGCLTDPNYNEGQESCWDENQNDIEG